MKLISPIGLIGLIGLMTSCCHSHDEMEPTPEPVSEEVAITFSGHETETVEAVTRAGTPLNEAGKTQFKVWGYKSMTWDDQDIADPTDDVYTGNQLVFPGYTVKWQANSAATTTTNSSGWEYILLDPADQTIKYWDWAAQAYRFYGVTGDLSGTDGTYVTNGTYKTHEFTIDADATDPSTTPFYTRLWFSTGVLPTYADKQFGKPVQLEFLKPYASVRFIFKYTNPREGINLTNISFKPTDDSQIVRKGSVKIIYPLDGTATREWFTMTPNDDPAPAVNKALAAFTEDADPEDDTKVYTETDNGWYMVLPNISQGTYTLTLKVNNADKTAVVPAEFMQWQPGYSYTYIFKVTDEGGVEIGWVESAVTPWTEMAIERHVYNW